MCFLMFNRMSERRAIYFVWLDTQFNIPRPYVKPISVQLPATDVPYEPIYSMPISTNSLIQTRQIIFSEFFLQFYSHLSSDMMTRISDTNPDPNASLKKARAKSILSKMY